MRMSDSSVILVIVVVVLIIFVVGRCKLNCSNRRGKKEGYTRSVLGQQNISTFARSEVDYMSYPDENPHREADPTVKYHSLEGNPVDLYTDQRKLEGPYRMFAQYENTWGGCWDGCHAPTPSIRNDVHSRYNLRNEGDVSVARQLDFNPPLERTPYQRRTQEAINRVDPVQSALPYGFKDLMGD